MQVNCGAINGGRHRGRQEGIKKVSLSDELKSKITKSKQQKGRQGRVKGKKNKEKYKTEDEPEATENKAGT